jgi:putative hydrolase of HD superfamily
MNNDNFLKDKINSNYIKQESAYEKYQNIEINNDLIKFYYQFNHLKNIYRQGWLKGLLENPDASKIESVADHSWAVAMLAISIIEKYKLDYDINKCMKLAIIHELGEIYAGDYTPRDNINIMQKHELEKEAVDKLISTISFENDFLEIWEEFENQETNEAVFIKQVDRLECIMQASCYNLDTSYMKRDIESITLPCLKEIIDELNRITQNNDIPYCVKFDSF